MNRKDMTANFTKGAIFVKFTDLSPNASREAMEKAGVSPEDMEAMTGAPTCWRSTGRPSSPMSMHRSPRTPWTSRRHDPSCSGAPCR